MTPDGSRGVNVQTDVGATVPALKGLWIAILSSSALFLLFGALAVVLPVVRQPKPGPSTLQSPPVPPIE
jgi:hypothetical protein